MRSTGALLVVTSFVCIAGACKSEGSSPPPPAPVDDASACTFTGEAEQALVDPPRHTPRWAFEPWISKDISSTDDTYDFVGGFQQRNIPVGAVVLDSPWETNYNTFVPNPTRYHDFADLVTKMHG